MQETTTETNKTILFHPHIKKTKNHEPKKIYRKNKKRIVCEKWNIHMEHLTFEKQLEMIQTIHENKNQTFDYESRIMIREIERKIYGYKQQDLEKGWYNPERFLSLDDVIQKMISCNMKCFYCFGEMYLLYETVRESKQWSVDRLDNRQGHNHENFVLACLECNLKRRCRTADKFLFTKQLSIVKKEEQSKNENSELTTIIN